MFGKLLRDGTGEWHGQKALILRRKEKVQNQLRQKLFIIPRRKFKTSQDPA